MRRGTLPRQIGERDLRAVLCPARPPAREGSAISPREMPTPAGNPPRFFRRCPEPFSPGGAQRFQSGCGDALRALKNSRCAAIFLAIRPIPWPGPSRSVVFYCGAIKNSRCAAIFCGHPFRLPRSGGGRTVRIKDRRSDRFSLPFDCRAAEKPARAGPLSAR